MYKLCWSQNSPMWEPLRKAFAFSNRELVLLVEWTVRRSVRQGYVARNRAGISQAPHRLNAFTYRGNLKHILEDSAKELGRAVSGQNVRCATVAEVERPAGQIGELSGTLCMSRITGTFVKGKVGHASPLTFTCDDTVLFGGHLTRSGRRGHPPPRPPRLRPPRQPQPQLDRRRQAFFRTARQ